MLELIATAAMLRCNVYYNSATPAFRSVPCQATFKGDRLDRVNVWLPHVGRFYDWKVGHHSVTPDPRWPECVRYTRPEGNQYQVCTVKSATELQHDH
jgi:hypothetical protein